MFPHPNAEFLGALNMNNDDCGDRRSVPISYQNVVRKAPRLSVAILDLPVGQEDWFPVKAPISGHFRTFPGVSWPLGSLFALSLEQWQ